MRTFCLVIASILAASAQGESSTQKTATPIVAKKEFLVGGDISALTQIEKLGGVFRDKGEPGDPIRIMMDRGANCFRLRLFVRPNNRGAVVNDLAYTVALGRRIKKAGARFLLDFHYSDTWADPGHQVKPEAWKDLDFEALESRVRTYSRDCLVAFREADALPDLVQPGNEITPGMLWPDGKLHGEGDIEEQWAKFARLLKAGIRGIEEGAGEQRPRIVIHIDRGGDWPATKRFFDNIEKRGVPYDAIGLSYYPWWHGTIDDLRQNLRNTAAAYKKDVFVVEAAYGHRPFRMSNGRYWDDEKAMRWPMTPEGQKGYLAAVVQAVKEAPEGRGLGVLWWYPEAIPVQGLRVWNGGATALFDAKGNALPALDAFRNAPETGKEETVERKTE